MTVYDSSFFDLIRGGARSSAAAVVPLVVEDLAPGTVVDVGCGEGWWGAEFARLGATVRGVDDHDCPTLVPFLRHDLLYPLPIGELGRVDLAVCLEVAEHLPAARAPGLVADLCALSGTVLFSAAIPGQGGVGHLNEQWPQYWVDLFADNGYAASGALRWRIWDLPDVDNWYRQNLLLFAETPWPPHLFNTPLAAPKALVHPVLWDHHRALRGRR